MKLTINFKSGYQVCIRGIKTWKLSRVSDTMDMLILERTFLYKYFKTPVLFVDRTEITSIMEH